MMMSSSAKADDPVHRAARDLTPTSRVTGCPAFAGHDGFGVVAMGPGSRGACHRARIRATLWFGRDDDGLKRRRQFLRARQIAVAVHPAIGYIKQSRHRVVADRHRIALVA